MISYLQVDNLSKRFGEQLLFENISFGIGKGQKVALIKQILSELKIDSYDKKIGQLSGGQKKRVGLAKVLISNPDFLILD